MAGDKSILFIRELSKPLKDRFKAWCARRGLTMKQAIVLYMKECIENDAKAKAS